MSRREDGRVELTWTNKHRRLVVFDEPGDGLPYRWVEPSDYRAAEVRSCARWRRLAIPAA